MEDMSEAFGNPAFEAPVAARSNRKSLLQVVLRYSRADGLSAFDSFVTLYNTSPLEVLEMLYDGSIRELVCASPSGLEDLDSSPVGQGVGFRSGARATEAKRCSRSWRTFFAGMINA